MAQEQLESSAFADREIAPGEFDFLSQRIDGATLKSACLLARRWGVPVSDVLIANGWIGRDEYYRCLAKSRGIAYIEPAETGLDIAANDADSVKRCLKRGLLRIRGRPSLSWAAAPVSSAPIAASRLSNDWRKRGVAMTSPATVRSVVERQFARRLAIDAVHGLSRRHPDASAARGVAAWQLRSLAAIIVVAFLLGLLAPASAFAVACWALALAFMPVAALRAYAFFSLSPPHQRPAARLRTPDAALPVYTILVPMFREANVLCDLVSALSRLDWPAAKLDIKLVLEETDFETLKAARAIELPGQFEIVVVPDGRPRTKPKALNYALSFARGKYLVIYDAEDRPHPGQLRAAHAAFAAGPPDLACLQARLGFYNRGENWMTRQFELEYAALFDGLLPALERLGFPIPLGGTSNHFKTSALIWLKAWDAFNVTEDADLGMRLARYGFGCAMLDSATLEEAPSGLRNWTPQRTRWLKGYMQTYSVHMRRPVHLLRALGLWRFAGFQLIFAGMILTALVHPWCYVLAASQALDLAARGTGQMADLVILAALGGIGLTGFAASMALAARTAARRGSSPKWRDVFSMPLYWLMVSGASYRALWQLWRDPFLWEKTAHGVPRNGARSIQASEILTLR